MLICLIARGGWGFLSMGSEVQKLVSNILAIDRKIIEDINSNKFDYLSRFLSDKNDFIMKLKEILVSQINVDDIDDLTKLLNEERGLVRLVMDKISQLKESNARDKSVINSLTKYLKVTRNLTENLNLKG